MFVFTAQESVTNWNHNLKVDQPHTNLITRGILKTGNAIYQWIETTVLSTIDELCFLNFIV